MALLPFTGPFGQLGTPARRALVRLMAPRYLEGAFPTPADFVAHCGFGVGTPEYQAKRAEVWRLATEAIATTIADDYLVSALFAPSAAGSVVAVATMQIVRGAGATTLDRTIGAATSSLPTHRLLQGFRYPSGAGLRADETPEEALAEFTRLVVAAPEDLRGLVANGTLTASEATHVAQHGFDEMIARAYATDQWPAAPRAYLFNTRPRLARALRRRKGFALIPLFHDGVEPTARALQPGKFNTAYFRRWAVELATVVPAATMADGTAAAIAWLAARDFAGWESLSLSLPYLVLNDRATGAAMGRLASSYAHPAQEDLLAAD